MADAWGGSWGTSWDDAWGSISVEQALLANDVTSASSVTSPVLGQGVALLADDVISASFVSQPTAAEGGVALVAEDVTSASFVSTPVMVVWAPVTGGGDAGVGGGAGGGYYERRRGKEDEEERESERKRRLRELADIIDRAIARAQGQLEPPSEAETPLPVAEIKAIDDALEAIQDRVQAIEALGSRILQADAELEALRLEAIDLIREAELDDDDEALELLLAA